MPLTVSPFLSLPSAVTLPYTFRSVPTSLPASVTVDNGNEKAKYVISSTGHTAHPDDIINSCKALQDHLQTRSEGGQKAIKDWEQEIKERELAEKRKIAPGWLDREEKILQPLKAESKRDSAASLLDTQNSSINHVPAVPTDEGAELDRAFGGLGFK